MQNIKCLSVYGMLVRSTYCTFAGKLLAAVV